MLSSIDNKSVFPIVSKERSGNYKYDPNFHALDKRIQPLTVSDVIELKESGVVLPSVVNEGSLLMRHPYRPNTLIDLSLDNLQYLQEKFGEYAIILNYLGARDQNLKAKITKLETRVIDANGKIQLKGKGSLKGVFKRFTEERFEVKYSKHITASQDCDYEKAEEYAKTVGLINDSFVREILALRKDHPIDTFDTDVVISKDYNDIIDVAASLQIMAASFGLNGNFHKAVSVREQISISQKLCFI